MESHGSYSEQLVYLNFSESGDVPVSVFSPAELCRNLLASGAIAHSQRATPRDTDRPMVIAVAALGEQLLTTSTTALISAVLGAAVRPPVVAVDGDGINQPLRGVLGSSGAGDLISLAHLPGRDLKRSAIESYADTTCVTPLLSVRADNPEPVASETLLNVVQRASHRWPVVVVDLPFTCGGELIAAGTGMATHVVLLTDKYHPGHPWLYQPGHHLTVPAQSGRVTVIKVGAQPAETDPQDTLTLPATGMGRSARDRLIVPDDASAVIQYNQLLSRLYN